MVCANPLKTIKHLIEHHLKKANETSHQSFKTA